MKKQKDLTVLQVCSKQSSKSWIGLHSGVLQDGTLSQLKSWARDREESQIIDNNGFVRFVCRNHRLIKV